MTPKDVSAIYERLANQLASKGYNEIHPVEPLQAAYFKLGALGLPYVVAVKDARYSTDSPTRTLQRVEGWFEKFIGRTGAGLLIFIYDQPTAMTIEEIRDISGQVVCGAIDAFTGKEWVPDYLGWRAEITG